MRVLRFLNVHWSHYCINNDQIYIIFLYSHFWMGEKIKLNLGCGNKILDGWDNYDIKHEHDKRIHFIDLESPLPFKERSVDEILLDNVFEHIRNRDRLLKEIHRCLSEQGILRIRVPYFKQPGAYRRDHVAFFTLSIWHQYNLKMFDSHRIKPIWMSDVHPITFPFDIIGRISYTISKSFYEHYVSSICPLSMIEVVCWRF